jgi:predicted transcriptional regulator
MESEAHKQFVRNAVEYIKRTFGVEENQMSIDLGEPGKTPPTVIDGFRADIYVHTPKYIIIGEAKTDNDIVKKHTLAQLAAYIKEVKTFEQERHIVMSSSWSSYATMRNFIRNFRKPYDLSDITFHTVDPMRKGEILP